MPEIYRAAVGYRALLCRPMILVLLLVNVTGAIVYLVVLARLGAWVIPGQPVSGEAFVWFPIAAPIYVIYALINSVWGIVILMRRQWRSGSLWLLAMSIWLVAIAIDFAHH